MYRMASIANAIRAGRVAVLDRRLRLARANRSAPASVWPARLALESTKAATGARWRRRRAATTPMRPVLTASPASSRPKTVALDDTAITTVSLVHKERPTSPGRRPAHLPSCRVYQDCRCSLREWTSCRSRSGPRRLLLRPALLAKKLVIPAWKTLGIIPTFTRVSDSSSNAGRGTIVGDLSFMTKCERDAENACGNIQQKSTARRHI